MRPSRGIHLTLIRSRIGRRVAALFVLCGLVPLVVLAAITISSVAAQQRDREERDLTALAKESSMHGLGRLVDLDERLRTAHPGPDGIPLAARLPGVLSMAVYDRAGRRLPTTGATAPVLDATQRARLASGAPVLRLPERPSQPALLVVPLSGGDGSRLGLGAEVDLAALWALDEAALDTRGTRRICLQAAGITLACTYSTTGGEAAMPPGGGGRGTGVFTAHAGEQEWMGAYWAAPLTAHYGLPELTAVVSMPEAEAAVATRDLLRMVGLVTVATLCLALLVSLRQIRRLLDPIARLEAATARLAAGDFKARVDVRTGDEVQQLGDAFNAMAQDIQRQFEQLHALSVGTLEALARAIDAKSHWTAGHSTRVAHVAVAIARTMGYDAAGLERIWRGGLLHDLGKIALSPEILDRAGPLSAAEMALVREHPTVGARILEPLPHCADILPMVLQHHERPDGRGYPAGLAGDAISLDARILAVADVYDAMTSRRPYRDGLDPQEVLSYLKKARGSHVDGAVVDAFAEAFESGGLPSPMLEEPDLRIA